MTTPLGPDDRAAEADAILRAAGLEDWDALAERLAPALGEAAASGVVDGADGLPDVSDEAFRLANADAIRYAADRAAELVGRRRIGDALALTDSPAPWAITETTRAELRALVTHALEAGWSPAELRAAIEASTLFSPTRAAVIARTELALAHTAGNLALWTRSGVVQGKRWLIGDLHDQDDICDDNVRAGVVPLGQAFPSGVQGPPAHPNCACVVIPVVAGA